VIAETGFRLVGRHHIKIPAIQIFESAEGIAASRQAVADLGTKLREYRGFQKEMAQAGFLVIQDFLGQEIEDAAVTLHSAL